MMPNNRSTTEQAKLDFAAMNAIAATVREWSREVPSRSSEVDRLAAAALMARSVSDSADERDPEETFSINLLPSNEDFVSAEIALDTGDVSNVSLGYFQHYVALIAMCVRRGHNHVADIVGQLAPLVGPENAGHLIWLIEILAGPAADVHLWDQEDPERGMHIRGSAIYLKPELNGPASTVVF